ncbi:MAG: glutathione peroxidase [Verrucomicrobiota bacterium]
MKLILLFFAAGLAAQVAQVAAAGNVPSIQNIPLEDINGKPTSLKDYAGKVILLVNVASLCGNTPQYKGLEAMYEKYKDKGLVIIGVPCNDFGSQEPGSAEEIKTFCTEKYSVTFPLMAKIHVKGPEQHPLYAALTSKDAAIPGPAGDIDWNFAKFVIGRDGKPVKRFANKVQPDSTELVQTVETALAQAK